MSVEKFWLVEFGSNLGSFGKGVAVLETGNIFAGDSGYYYTGIYDINNHVLNAKIKVIRHNPNWNSIIGDVNELNVVFENQSILNGLDKSILKGYYVENPSIQISAKFTKIADLP
ncbi:MAG: hypothetical protein PHE67_08700 [Campylobacterales bacterium]|nr:hypothetical protein [Campylobacterales bacterium]